MATNEQRLELRRSRMKGSPPILRGGFRPFFLASASWALFALTIWLGILFGTVDIDSIDDPLAWHRHEMLFGFTGAAITGFVLTAVPNWTGRLPIAGTALAGLFALWLAGRVYPFAVPEQPIVSALLDGGFHIILAALLGREIVRSGNRNLPVVGLIAVFGIANLLDRLEMGGVFELRGLGWRGGLSLVLLLIALIAGRIIPSFTRNWLASRRTSEPLPTQADRFDLSVLGLNVMALMCWTAAPMAPATGMLLILSGGANSLRLVRWQGWRCISDPLVVILHIGYGWLATGLLLLGLSCFDLVTETAAIHALTTGAIATMILAVMTRATLGHTGRALSASRTTILSYTLLTAAAVMRVFASFPSTQYDTLIAMAGSAWVIAFGLFLAEYGPMLWSSRIDESKDE